MNRSPFLPLGVALVVLLLACVGYVFWHGTVTQASEEAATLAGEVAGKSGAIAESASTRTVLTTLSADETFIEGLSLSVAEIVPFLEELEATGGVFNSRVAVVSVSDAAAEGQVSVSFSVVGSFDAVMRTIGTIEYGAHASKIDKLTLDRTAGAEEWSAAVTLILSVRSLEQP